MTGVLSGIIGSIKGGSPPKTAPTSLSAIATSTNVAISFTAPSDNGGSAITNYEYSFNNSSWTALSPADAVSPITVSGLTQSTAYNIYLRAVNINGSGPASSAVSFTTQGVPTSTIGATTNFTESRAVFNATINGNLATTTVSFQYSTASNFSSFTSIAGSGSGTGSFSSSATVTGLAVNTTYYVRAVATNSVGSTTSGSTSFLTWHLIQWANGTPGTYYLTVPTVPGVNPAPLVNALFVSGGGGGGGGNSDVDEGGGGGAGGYAYTASTPFNGPSGALTIRVGGGGAGGGIGAQGGGGGWSYLDGPNMTFQGSIGGEGGFSGTNPRGGNVGAGSNPAYTGGAGFSEVIFKSTFYVGGGGAGVNGNGGAPYVPAGSTFYVGGNGGPGGTIAIPFGAGGGGGSGSVGTGGGYGNGGQGGNGAAGAAGAGGAVIFNYYGP